MQNIRMSVPNAKKCASHPIAMHEQVLLAGPLTGVRPTSSGPGTWPPTLPQTRLSGLFSEGAVGGADTRSLPHSIFPRNHSKHRGGVGDGAGPSLEDLLGMGLVSLREPEGSPQAFQSIELWGVCHPEGDRLSRHGSGGRRRMLRRPFAEAGRGAERRELVAGGRGHGGSRTLGQPRGGCGWGDLVFSN